MCRCVWSRNLKNEEAMARVGPQRHKEKKLHADIYTIFNILLRIIYAFTMERVV